MEHIQSTLFFFLIINMAGRVASENRTLKVTSILTKPYLMRKNSGELYGFIPDLVAQLADILRFDYRIVLVADGRYGSKRLDGTWNGMIGELTRNEADFAAAPLTITSTRSTVVDFSPFEAIDRVMLMNKETAQIVRSFDDLANNDDVKVAVVRESATENYLRESKMAVFQRIWRRCHEDTRCSVTTTHEGVQRVREEDKTVMIMESSIAEYVASRRPCDTVVVGRWGSDSYGIATPLNSDLRDQLHLAVLKLHEGGELEMLRNKWHEIGGGCPSFDVSMSDGRRNLSSCLKTVVLSFILTLVSQKFFI